METEGKGNESDKLAYYRTKAHITRKIQQPTSFTMCLLGAWTLIYVNMVTT